MQKSILWFLPRKHWETFHWMINYTDKRNDNRKQRILRHVPLPTFGRASHLSTLVYMLVRAMSNWSHTNSSWTRPLLGFWCPWAVSFSSKDIKTVHCNTFIKHALRWTKRKVSFGQTPPPPGNSKIRRKSADFSYSHKKIDIRNAFADWSRLARSLVRLSSDTAFLVERIRLDLMLLREEGRSRKQIFRLFNVSMWHHIRKGKNWSFSEQEVHRAPLGRWTKMALS